MFYPLSDFLGEDCLTPIQAVLVPKLQESVSESFTPESEEGEEFPATLASLLSVYFTNSLSEEKVNCDFSLCAIAIHAISVFEGLFSILEDESGTVEEISEVTKAQPLQSIFTSEKKKQSYSDAKQVFDLLFQEALLIHEGCSFQLWRAYRLCQSDLKAINARAGCLLSIYSEDSRKTKADLIYLLFYQYFQPP